MEGCDKVNDKKENRTPETGRRGAVLYWMR